MGDDALRASRKPNNRTAAALICGSMAVLICFLAYDALANRQEFSQSDIAMGTVISQQLTGPDTEATADKIIGKIKEIEKDSLSWRIKGSEIYNINLHAGKAVKISAETAGWLKKSLEVCKNSGGALDITVGKLTALWGIGTESARLPKQAEIDGLLGGVGYEKVKIAGNDVKIADGQSLDMGSVGKGIACDEAFKILEAKKTKSAVISVGGSILLYGEKKEVNVGIRNPRGGENDYMGILSLKNCCVSTSGDYEKFIIVNGKKYHHILNPKTGYPSDSGLMSVTVVCQSGLLSDALSTACFVLGYEKSLPLLKEYNAEAVFITNSSSVYVTDGLAGKFKLSNTADYKLEATD